MAGFAPLSAVPYFQQFGVNDPTASDTGFVKRFLQNKGGNPDETYNEFLKMVSAPNISIKPETGIGAILRRATPFMDTQAGHQMLLDTLRSYPYTPMAQNLLKSAL